MSSSFSPQTRNAAVLGELRQRILHGTLKPGDRILADAVAEELGVSRIPVREALRVLEGERQVSYEPHRGYFVTKLRLGDLVELDLMRHLLEAEALRRSVPRLDQETYERMEDALRKLDRADKAGDITTYSIVDRDFHLAFLGQLEMPRFLAEIESLYDQCDGYGSLYYDNSRNRRASRRDHLAMLVAAKKRDTATVVGLLREHRDRVVEAHRGVPPDGAGYVAASGETPKAANGSTPRRNTRSRGRKAAARSSR